MRTSRNAAIGLTLLVALIGGCGRATEPEGQGAAQRASDLGQSGKARPGAQTVPPPASVTAPQPQGKLPLADASEFSVATYNVNFGNVDLRQTVAVIRKAGADLVALQETNAASEAYLLRSLATTYPHVYFRGDRGRYAAERFGFLSKSPIAGFRYLPAKHGLFGTWIGQADLAGRTIQVANVHLQPVLLRRGDGILAVLEALQQMEKAHADEIQYIYENLTPDLPTLVVGDFNSLSTHFAPTFLAQKGFVDSFASVNARPDTHPTWHWRTRPIPLAARFDYIFHSNHFQTVASRVVQSTASDHHLVVSRLLVIPLAGPRIGYP